MAHPELSTKLNLIEAELRKLGYLKGEATLREDVHSAFAYGQMSFEEWLGHVFLPNARSAAESGCLPSGGKSNVGAAAVRNFDGVDEAEDLISLLIQFDAQVNGLARLQAARS